MDGALGSGKTLLSVAIGTELIRRKGVDGVWGNFEHGLIESHKVDRTLFLLDETWQFADSRKSSDSYEAYGAFVRKARSYFMGGSVFAADKRMRQLKIQRSVSLLSGLVDVWLFSWATYDRSQAGVFFLVHPTKFYGTYNTYYLPEHDNGLQYVFKEMMAHAEERICPNCGELHDELYAKKIVADFKRELAERARSEQSQAFYGSGSGGGNPGSVCDDTSRVLESCGGQVSS